MIRFLLAAATLVTFLAAGLPAAADEKFPARPVKIVMPVPAGSALDVLARLVGDQLSHHWAQQAIIENCPGGSGLIAAQAVAAAPADGHTLLGGVASIFTILPAEKAGPSIDVNRDFVPIGLIGGGGMYIAVSPKLGVASLREFIALARSRPQEIVVGTNGVGTLPYFAARALAKMGDIPVTVVPYASGGTTAAIGDILGGRVHATIEGMSGLRGAVELGDLKLIAVMTPDRVPRFPDLATVAETVPGLTAIGWLSLAAPAATPAPIVERLGADLRHALEAPSVRQRLDELGLRGKSMTPAETRAFIADEQKLWWPIVRETGAR